MSGPTVRARRLKAALDRLYMEYDRAAALTDPIELVRRFDSAADREVAGLVAASLAFGRVAGVMRSVARVLDALGPSPAETVRRFDPASDRLGLGDIRHRWVGGDDIVALVWAIRQMLERSGSVEQFFLDGDPGATADLGPAIEAFSRRATGFGGRAAHRHSPSRPGVAHFFPRPSAGSACKRLNLYLRWMVRRDAVDLGAWRPGLAPRLVIPLDTHVVRVGRCLGLTSRRTPGWRMAVEITEALRRIDPADPVRYDFALCHLGMHGLCGFGKAQADGRCPLKGICSPRRMRHAPAPARPA